MTDTATTDGTTPHSTTTDGAPVPRGTGTQCTGERDPGPRRAAGLEVRPAGSRGLLIDAGSAERAQALHAELLRRRAEGTVRAEEIVPAERTVLIDGIDGPGGPGALARWLRDLHLPPVPPQAGGLVEIPVRYDGPDLADVAALWGMSAEAAVRLHTAARFRVAFCGFAPGFGYLTGLGARYRVPRRATPRTRVPAGSVALAGPYTGVYPGASPGGWQLVGTTDTVLWDPARTPAALLTPGTRVRFVPQERR